MGFSMTTCFPAFSADTARSACWPVGLQMITASMSGLRNRASTSVVDPPAPYFPAMAAALDAVDVGDDGEFRTVGQLGQGLSVHVADHAGADDGETDLTAAHA